MAYVLALTGAASAADGIRAITVPSEDRLLTFLKTGRVADVPIKGGQHVEAGQVLVQLDDAVERLKKQQVKAEAENQTRIEAAQADLDQKNVDLAKMRRLFEKEVATEWEMQHAILDVLIAELTLKLTKFQHDQDQLTLQEAEIDLERMKLKTPIDGIVERVFVETGESVDPSVDVVRVVNIDPLWIDVPVPLAEAHGLRVEQSVTVTFPGDPDVVAKGRIIKTGAVADAASETLPVRVEVPNPSGRPAGEHVTVELPQSAVAEKGHGKGLAASADGAPGGAIP
jgi:RND family efflux transporter MFP subunit